MASGFIAGTAPVVRTHIVVHKTAVVRVIITNSAHELAAYICIRPLINFVRRDDDVLNNHLSLCWVVLLCKCILLHFTRV